jgi:hypothetical protein
MCEQRSPTGGAPRLPRRGPGGLSNNGTASDDSG